MPTLVQIAASYLRELWSLLSSLWLYFLLGFVLAGLIAEFVPARTLLRYLGKNTLGTLLRATVAGTAASLCSCGAIPVAVTMRSRGASRAAALTFLLAAPWAGFTQLVILYRFLGFAGAAVVFIGALSVALLTGIILARLEDRGWLAESLASSASRDNPSLPLAPEGPASPRSRRERMMRAGAESWHAFLGLWKYLAFGLLLAAAVTAFVPADWVPRYLGSEARFNPVLAAVPLAALVELCSEGFSVFAGQLYAMGATLSVVFVMVLVGVATDFTEIAVIWGKFGKRSAAAYLAVSTLVTVGFGLAIQSTFG